MTIADSIGIEVWPQTESTARRRRCILLSPLSQFVIYFPFW